MKDCAERLSSIESKHEKDLSLQQNLKATLNEAFAIMRRELEDFYLKRFNENLVADATAATQVQTSSESIKEISKEIASQSIQNMPNTGIDRMDVKVINPPPSDNPLLTDNLSKILHELKGHRVLHLLDSIQNENAININHPVDLPSIFSENSPISQSISPQLELKKQFLLLALNCLMFLPDSSEDSAIIHDFISLFNSFANKLN
jgi:hypothetical protein